MSLQIDGHCVSASEMRKKIYIPLAVVNAKEVLMEVPHAILILFQL